MPILNHDTAPVFAAWQDNRFDVPRCRACRTWIFPPRGICPACWSDDVALEPTATRGRLVSYSRPRVRSGESPQVTAVVSLDEAPGVQLVVRSAEAATGAERVGARVVIVWGEDAGGVVPRFRLDADRT